MAAFTDQNTSALVKRFAHLVRASAAESPENAVSVGGKLLQTLFGQAASSGHVQDAAAPVEPCWSKCVSFYAQAGVMLDIHELAFTAPFLVLA